MLQTRIATAADVTAYYGHPSHETLKAYVAILGGECVGLVGIARAGANTRFFSDFKPELRPYIGGPSVMRAVLRALKWVQESKVPVITIATPDEPNAEVIIRKLGFVHYAPSEHGEVYVWPR